MRAPPHPPPPRASRWDGARLIAGGVRAGQFSSLTHRQAPGPALPLALHDAQPVAREAPGTLLAELAVRPVPAGTHPAERAGLPLRVIAEHGRTVGQRWRGGTGHAPVARAALTDGIVERCAGPQGPQAQQRAVGALLAHPVLRPRLPCKVRSRGASREAQASRVRVVDTPAPVLGGQAVTRGRDDGAQHTLVGRRGSARAGAGHVLASPAVSRRQAGLAGREKYVVVGGPGARHGLLVEPSSARSLAASALEIPRRHTRGGLVEIPGTGGFTRSAHAVGRHCARLRLVLGPIHAFLTVPADITPPFDLHVPCCIPECHPRRTQDTGGARLRLDVPGVALPVQHRVSPIFRYKNTTTTAQNSPRAVVAGPVEPPRRLGKQVVGVGGRFVRAQRAGCGCLVVAIRSPGENTAHALGRGDSVCWDLVESSITPPVRHPN